VQGGDSPQHAVDPVSIPHDVGNRGVATGIDRKLHPQVSAPFRPPPQVTNSVRGTLSRWRHGFEPRWDYERRTLLGGVSQTGGPAAGLGHNDTYRFWLVSDGGDAAHNFVVLAQDRGAVSLVSTPFERF
jgi:hypothetical protein